MTASTEHVKKGTFYYIKEMFTYLKDEGYLPTFVFVVAGLNLYSIGIILTPFPYQALGVICWVIGILVSPFMEDVWKDKGTEID